MKRGAKFSIGDTSRICKISPKALRFYDKINLISAERQAYNNYRYYTGETLLTVVVIKYYKQMGFTLEEIAECIKGKTMHVYKSLQKSFRKKMAALEREQEQIRQRYVSVKDWLELIMEAELVISNSISEVSIRYANASGYLFQEQFFDGDIRRYIINIDFMDYVESINNAITGPVIINFSSFADRMKGNSQPVKILQKTLLPCENEMQLGGCMMATCYHTGAYDTIDETYKKMRDWTAKHGYTLAPESYERYVTDYWTTSDSSLFVTEIMVRVSRKDA
jgi:DNA-binding transcriptional MerR regulator/effector-binding domain-containing protein